MVIIENPCEDCKAYDELSRSLLKRCSEEGDETNLNKLGQMIEEMRRKEIEPQIRDALSPLCSSCQEVSCSIYQEGSLESDVCIYNQIRENLEGAPIERREELLKINSKGFLYVREKIREYRKEMEEAKEMSKHIKGLISKLIKIDL